MSSDAVSANDKAKDTHEPVGSDLSRRVLDPKHLHKKPHAGETDAHIGAQPHKVPAVKVGKDGSLHFDATPEPAESPISVPKGVDKPAESTPAKPADARPDASAKAPTEIERQKLITAAVDLHDAANQSSLLVFSSPDVPKIMNIIEPMNAAQRKQLQQEYATKFPGRDLVTDLKDKLSTPDAARAEAVFKRLDGVADNSGQIHEALAKIQSLGLQSSDQPEVARIRAEKEIRDSVNTLTSAQLSEVESKYKKDYGRDLKSDLQGNDGLTDLTKNALKTYMNGADHRSDQDTLTVANDALKNGRPDIFNEVFRDASATARQTFAANDGAKKIDQAFDGSDAKIAKDYATRGEVSLSTIVDGDTHWYHTNRDDITRAVKSVSDQDRVDFIQGEKLAKSHIEPVSVDDKRAAAMYKSVNDSLHNVGTEREADLWKAQLTNQESVTRGLLEARSDGGLLGIGAGVDKNEAFSAVENLSEKDWQFLRDHPYEVSRIDQAAHKYDGNYSDRIMSALYAKLNVDDYKQSQKIGLRPLTERLTDNSDNTANRVDAITSMNEAERYSYAQNYKGYRTYIDSVLKSDDERLLATRLSRTSAPPDATDQVLVDKLKGADPLKSFNDIEAALKVDPALKDCLQNPITEQDRALNNAFHEAARAAVDKAGLGDQSYGEGAFVPGQYDAYDNAVFKNGSVPLDLKLQLTSDRREQIDTIMHAPDTEKSRLLDKNPDAATKAYQDTVLGSKDSERQVILNGLQQKDESGRAGYLQPADRMRLLALNGTNFDDMKQMLSGMSLDQRQSMANDYYTKYHALVTEDAILKVSPDQQWRFRELLAPTDLNVRQVALDAQHSNDSHASNWDDDMKNKWDFSRVAADSAQDNLTKFAAQHGTELSQLSSEQRKQFDDAVANYTAAQKSYVDSKGQFAETFVDATLTVTAVGGALFSGGTSLALLGAVGGAAYRVGMKASIEGGDFDSSANNVLKQGFEGATQGALGFLGPEQLGLTMSLKVGSELAGASAAKLVSGSAQALFKDGSETVIKEGLANLTRQGAIAGDKEIAALADKVAAEGMDKSAVQQAIASQIKSDTMTGVKNILLNEGEAYAKSIVAAQIGSQGKEILSTAAGFESPETLLQRMKDSAISTAAGVTLFHGVFKLGAAGEYARVALGRDAQGHIVAGDGTVIRHPDGTFEPVVGKDKLVKLNAGDAIFEKGSLTEESDGSKTFTVGDRVTRFDASGKVTQVGDQSTQHSMDFSYSTDAHTNQPLLEKATAYKPDGTVDESRSLTRENGVYYTGNGISKVSVGTEAVVDKNGSLIVKGQASDSEIGKGRSTATDKSQAVESIVYNPDGTRTFKCKDNFQLTRDGRGQTTEFVNSLGVKAAFEFKGPGNSLSKVDFAEQSWTLQNGKWLDKSGNVFADQITVYHNGSVVIDHPPDTLRTPTKPGEPVDKVEIWDDGRTSYTYKSISLATTDAVPPPEKLSSADYFKEKLQSGEIVKQSDGTYSGYDSATGADSFYDQNGRMIAQRTAFGDRHFGYDQSGSLNTVTYSENGSFKSAVEKHTTADGETWQETDGAGQILDQYARVSVGEDGSITKLGAGKSSDSAWDGIRERPDGLKVQVDQVGRESVDGSDLSGERARVQQLARDGFGDPVRQERFEQWSKDFEQAASKRNPPLSEKEIANTYYQLDRLITNDNSVLPHGERLALAEQFMYKAANPHTIGQGVYNTCNVTAEIEHRFIVLHPSDALRVVSDVATSGRFITDTGSVIDMSAMNNVMHPLAGTVHNQFNPSEYSGRDMFDQLFQSTVVEAHWQTQSGDGVKRSSTVWDLRNGEAFQPGDLRYEYTSAPDQGNSGEVINDYSTNPPTRKLVHRPSTMVDPLTGKLQSVLEMKPAVSPELTGQQMLSVGKAILGHEEPPHMLSRDGNDPYAVQVHSVEEMVEKLKEMQQNGGTPTTVFVDTRDKLISGRAEDGGRGGAHVINVQSIELRGDQYFVEFTNQWSAESDHLGERAVPAEELYRAMKYRPDAAAVLPISPASRRAALAKELAVGTGISLGIGATLLAGAYGAYKLYQSEFGDSRN
jgi:hypothetical protein